MMGELGFEIEEEVGRSSELRLCRARKTRDRQEVLLKLGRGDESRVAELWERELALCKNLEVEGVVCALEVVEHGGAAALVLENVPGLSLDRVLSRGPLPLPSALEIGRQLATTLSALHRRDVIHRDLRPVHVLYDEAGGRAHLTGLGRAAQVSRDVWRIPAPEVLEGDPTYLAPEATGRLARRLDYRADLYSLGVILFEMVTGRPPFTDSDPMARIHAHIAREPPDPKALRPEVPPVVCEILAKLLAKTAEARYRSGLGLAHDLERCLAELAGSGEIQAFEPGERDVAERFELPSTLVGREAELAWLEEALDTGRPAVRLVAGYSGVGKTALIDALRDSVRRRGGIFASGRHDPEQTVPYGALLSVLHTLVRQQLGVSTELLEVWTQRLRSELDVHLGVLTEALPELASLFDEVPAVPPTEPANVQSRFHSCIVRLLATLRTGGEGVPGAGQVPLVLFLDDLQWIDPSTADLLPRLADVGGFLFLGAYRDNEIGEGHPLRHALTELRARGVDVEILSLAPLTESDLGRLITEALLAPADSLAELVYRKTAGNPFFARTFLLTLHQRDLLRLGVRSAEGPPRWTWDLERIAALEATETAVELVARRLTELSPVARRALALAAVLGKEVDPETLAALREGDAGNRPSGEEETSTEEILLVACRDGFLVELESREEEPRGYTFVHDRVREGAVALLSAEERALVHLRIGRLLRRRAEKGEAVDIFEITEHSSHAAHLISDPDERRELVRLHQEAGRRARTAGAFPAAYTAFRRALDLLESEAGDLWQTSYERIHSLHVDAAESACLAGDFDAAERLEDVVLNEARSLLDRVPAEETRAYRLFAQRRVEAALRLQLEVLGQLGLEIPPEPTASDLWPAVLTADRAVAAVDKHGVLDLPAMRDPEKIAAARLLARTAMLAGWSQHTLSRLAMCRLVELTATAGVHPASPVAYAMMADVRQGELGDLAGARQVGELGLALLKHPAVAADDVACRFVFDIIVAGLADHPAVLRDRFLEDFHHSMAAGDLLLASGAAYQVAATGLFAGIELPRLEASVREFCEKVRGIGQQVVVHVIDGIGRLVGVLLGQGEIGEAVERIREVPREAAASVRVRLIGLELLVRVLLRDPEAPAVAREYLAMPKGMLPAFSLEFLCCLAFLDAAARAGEAEPAEVAPCFERLEARAREAPEVQGHKRDLILACRHRVAGRVPEALATCEQAIAGARQNRFPHEEALAHELAAELCLDPVVGREDAAATHLGEALTLYRQWGASAKVEQLDEGFADLLSAGSAGSLPLDVSSFEQAGQVLASELDLSRLLHRLAAVLLQNAGAQRAFLIRASPDGLAVEVRAESATPEPRVELLEELPIEASEELPATVVRFVARTLEVVIFDGAGHDSRFAGDPYLERVQPRSVLCLPLLHRGEALEIVYLENDTSPGVFSPERSGAVRLLASQAAAALANARLHDSLKQEVETRRRAEADLRQALAEVDALKNRLEAENVYLQEEIQSHFEEIVGDSEAIRKVLYKVEQVAATDATVLILGETGTGKELITRALHRLSRRRERPLVKVNCAALPATLIESELFGHEKGAFTGALSRKTGRFELADSGTLFLDEIGDLPLDLQAKLLRVLQEGELERLGGTKTTKVDVRVVAATNRDLEKAMAEGTFRPDLYYRLTVFPIELPPLRERDGDIPSLVRFFIDRKRGRLGSRVEKISQRVMERLTRYAWPGNVRELENVVERALILSPGKTLHLEEGFGGEVVAVEGPQCLVEVERAHILNVLEACDWKIKGRGHAAERLGLPPPTLRDRMKKLGIQRPG